MGIWVIQSNPNFSSSSFSISRDLHHRSGEDIIQSFWVIDFGLSITTQQLIFLEDSNKNVRTETTEVRDKNTHLFVKCPNFFIFC
ncbi:unnamed protein product [Brassica oleracea]